MITQKDRIEAITKKLMDEGKIIAAGWISLRAMILPADAPLIQHSEMRKAFFCGAAHLFSSMCNGMDEDAEPTDADIKRMDLIEAELKQFEREFEIEVLNQPPVGSA